MSYHFVPIAKLISLVRFMPIYTNIYLENTFSQLSNTTRIVTLYAMESNTGENYNFNGLKEKPEELVLLVDKYVRVQLIKNLTFTGFMHSIDPISYSMIMSVPQENNEFKPVLIPGHAILDIMEVETIPDSSLPIRKSSDSLKEETSKRKDKILAWLKWNMLPASESGDKIIFGNASLLPPYSDRDICTDNPIVVKQMRKIIKSMPQSFEAPEN